MRLRARRHAVRRTLRDQRGVVTIEFALLLPAILAVVFLIIDLGRVFNYMNDANQIAAAGARYAAVDNNPGGGTLQAYLQDQADTDELKDGGTDNVVDAIDVCIDFPNSSSSVGEPVRVKAETDFKIGHFITQFIGKEVTIPIVGEATMRIERPPTTYSADC